MAKKRSYGEACRLAVALDLIGERWALLIVRELLLGPKRFTDLRTGLPNASTNILSERLRELEEGAVVRRRTLLPPAAARVYELTEWGRELEPVVTQLGSWGARSPIPPEHRRINTDSIVLALRSLFEAERADDLEASYELRVGGETFHVGVAAGELDLERGPAAEPDATIEVDEAGTLAAVLVLTGQLPLAAAVESGAVRIAGSKREARRFLRLFPMPEPCACKGVEAGADAGTNTSSSPSIETATVGGAI